VLVTITEILKKAPSAGNFGIRARSDVVNMAGSPLAGGVVAVGGRVVCASGND
jgi:hypothetical protein